MLWHICVITLGTLEQVLWLVLQLCFLSRADRSRPPNSTTSPSPPPLFSPPYNQHHPVRFCFSSATRSRPRYDAIASCICPTLPLCDRLETLRKRRSAHACPVLDPSRNTPIYQTLLANAPHTTTAQPSPWLILLVRLRLPTVVFSRPPRRVWYASDRTRELVVAVANRCAVFHAMAAAAID